jgi:hypothetical protein
MKVSKKLCKLMSLETLATASSARWEATQLESIEILIYEYSGSQGSRSTNFSIIIILEPASRSSGWELGTGLERRQSGPVEPSVIDNSIRGCLSSPVIGMLSRILG